MKKLICLVLAMLLLTGCAAKPNEPNETAAPVETTQAPTAELPPETTVQATLPPTVPVPEITLEETVNFSNPGKIRIGYDGTRRYVRYVTSPKELPQEGDWEGYDEAYFENKALLIVVETLSSGSVQVELGSITRSEDVILVSLERNMSGDVGTSDMATWMLWAEVDKGLEGTWVLNNGSWEPNVEKY